MPRILLSRLTTYARQPLQTAEAGALLAGGLRPGESRRFDAADALLAAAGEDTAPVGVPWHGVIGIEGELTGDGRLIESNALRWEGLPLLLRATFEDNGFHDGAVVVGRILSITRGADGKLSATGDLDPDSADGQEAIRQVGDERMIGVSMDLDDVSFEVRVAKEVIDAENAMWDDTGDITPPADAAEVDADGRVVIMKMNSDDEVMVTTSARVRAATLVQIPAFADARIALDGPAPELAAPAAPLAASATVIPLRRRSLAASAGTYPDAPPRAWFADPELDGPTPFTIEGSGRVYGHLALWGTCHTAYPGQCISPPSSASSYSYFHTGSVLTAEGVELPIGRITLDTMHAGRSASAVVALAHYEHTGRVVTDVAAGEDVYGIWVAGAMRPSATPEQVRALRAAPLSGDWRRLGGSLEMIAALAVNTPGFPVPRPQGLVASGVVVSLVASGMLPPRQVVAPGQVGALSLDDLRYLKRVAARMRVEEAAGLAARARAVMARTLSRRVLSSRSTVRAGG